MTKRFEKAYKALITAFFEGTLAKGHCACCAVGNIVGESVPGGRITKEEFERITAVNAPDDWFLGERIARLWETMFSYRFSDKFLNYKLNPNVAGTGYSGEELIQIEKAFENNTKIGASNYCYKTQEQILKDQYNGLVAVFKVMCKLDNIENVDYKVELQKKENLVLV